MKHPFFLSTRPLIFAHRGGAALAPENSMAAFDNAVALGVDGVELDVRFSADRIVVVHHDRTLERTTRLHGPVLQHSAAELAQADVPTLAAVLQRHGGTRVIIEIKENTAALAAAVVEVVHAAAAVERVCIGSFGRRALRTVRQLDPAIATSAAREEVRWALYRSWVRWPLTTVPYAGYQVPEFAGSTRVVSRAFVTRAHRAGLGVQVWTVDTESDARRLLAWGVNALITDRPDRLVPLARTWAAREADAAVQDR